MRKIKNSVIFLEKSRGHQFKHAFIRPQDHFDAHFRRVIHFRRQNFDQRVVRPEIIPRTIIEQLNEQILKIQKHPTAVSIILATNENSFNTIQRIKKL